MSTLAKIISNDIHVNIASATLSIQGHNFTVGKAKIMHRTKFLTIESTNVKWVSLGGGKIDRMKYLDKLCQNLCSERSSN